MDDVSGESLLQKRTTAELVSEVVVPASTDTLSSAANDPQPGQKVTIELAPPEAADDEALVPALTSIVNAVYAKTEGGELFVKGYQRTNVDEVRQYVRAGEIAVAYLASSSESHREPIGCIRIQKLSSTHGEFGMMAIDENHRGSGYGRDLVHFVEDYCQGIGLSVMQLELLFPQDFEHKFKSRLHVWYTRMGYELIRTGDFMAEYPRLAKLLKTPCQYRIYEKSLA